VVSFTPWPLYSQRKRPWYPLDRRVGGPQSRSGCGGEEKNSHLLPGLESPIIQPEAQRYTNELSRLFGVIMSKLNSAHIFTSFFSEICFNILIPLNPRFLKRVFQVKLILDILKVLRAIRTVNLYICMNSAMLFTQKSCQ
jgi:hypothetical protein